MQQHNAGALVSKRSKYLVFYQEACRYWLKAQAALPFFSRNGVKIQPPHGRIFFVISKEVAAFLGCLLNSSLFYWYYSVFSDCEHVNDDLVKTIPVPPEWNSLKWVNLSDALEFDLAKNATRKKIKTKQGYIIEYDEIKASRSKSQIDKIDISLANIFGFTDEETDFIINYDIKYRMGGVDEEDE